MKKYLLLFLDVLNFYQGFCNFTIDEFPLKLNKNYSLIPPFDKDLNQFWLFRNVSISESKDRISLTSAKSYQIGALWNLVPILKTSWKAELKYTAFSHHEEIADGIAFWLLPPETSNDTPTRFKYGGPKTNFTGLMAAIDSYRNPSDFTLNRTRDEAAIIVVYNEKPRYFDWNSEGNDITSGRCLVQNRHRNSTKIISKLVVEYFDDELKVYHTNGTSELELCTTVKNLKIPFDYVIGLSASTGYYVGAYDVNSFKFYDVIKSVENFSDPKSQRKLLTYLYIVSGLLVFVSFICFIGSVHFLRKRFCKKQSTEDNESESQPDQIPTEILEFERDRRNMRLELMRQNQVIHRPVPRAPMMSERVTNTYEAVDDNGDNYNHLIWK